jgi:hypothetical protein
VEKRIFFHRSRRNMHKFDHLSDSGQHVLLLISAVRHSIQCFGMIGVDPTPEWFGEHISQEDVDRSSCDVDFRTLMKTDLVAMYTAAFCWSLGLDLQALEDVDDYIDDYTLKERLEESLRTDHPLGPSLFKRNANDLLENDWSSTFDGRGSYDLRMSESLYKGEGLAPIMCEVCAGPHAGVDNMCHTHRFAQFVKGQEDDPLVNSYTIMTVITSLLEHRNVRFAKTNSGGAGGAGGGGPDGDGGGGEDDSDSNSDEDEDEDGGKGKGKGSRRPGQTKKVKAIMSQSLEDIMENELYNVPETVADVAQGDWEKIAKILHTYGTKDMVDDYAKSTAQVRVSDALHDAVESALEQHQHSGVGELAEARLTNDSELQAPSRVGQKGSPAPRGKDIGSLRARVPAKRLGHGKILSFVASEADSTSEAESSGSDGEEPEGAGAGSSAHDADDGSQAESRGEGITPESQCGNKFFRRHAPGKHARKASSSATKSDDSLSLFSASSYPPPASNADSDDGTSEYSDDDDSGTSQGKKGGDTKKASSLAAVSDKSRPKRRAQTAAAKKPKKRPRTLLGKKTAAAKKPEDSSSKDNTSKKLKLRCKNRAQTQQAKKTAAAKKPEESSKDDTSSKDANNSGEGEASSVGNTVFRNVDEFLCNLLPAETDNTELPSVPVGEPLADFSLSSDENTHAGLLDDLGDYTDKQLHLEGFEWDSKCSKAENKSK